MDVRKRIFVISEGVDRLGDEVRELVDASEPPDLEEVVLALRDVHAVMAQLRDARGALAELGASLMPQQQMTVAGLPIERTGGWNRKEWQHEDLLAHVVRWAKEEQAEHARNNDGEVRESEGQAVVRILREVASLSYWKVGTTRDRGLDVDEFCRREAARPGIKLPRQ